MYVFVELNNIIGVGQARCLNEDVINIEVSDEVANNIDKYIYSNGKIILDPDYEEKQKRKERERLNMLSLTKREVFLALYKDKGTTPEQLRSKITDTEALIEFDYANDYFRGNPLIDKIGIMLGYSIEDLDYLFEHKELPKGGE